MNISNLIITKHARAQFAKRSTVAYPCGVRDVEATMTKLLKQAKKAFINVHSYVNRRARHKQEADYWFADVWRFVTIQIEGGKQLLLTCELREHHMNEQAKFLAKMETLSNERMSHGPQLPN